MSRTSGTTYTGNGVDITVIDTRVDLNHEDYDANYNTATDWDLCQRRRDAGVEQHRERNGTVRR